MTDSATRHDLVQLLAEYKAAEKTGDAKKTKRILDIVLRENWRLVEKLTTKVSKNLDGGRAITSLERDDLVQAGAIGLMRAFPRWIPEKGAFSTYAAHWLRLELQKAFAASHIVKKPKGHERPWSVTKQQDRFIAKYGREPEPEELERWVKESRLPDDPPIAVTEKKLDDWKMRAGMLSLDDSAMKRGMVSVQKVGNGGTGNNTGLAISDENTRHDIVPDPKPSPEVQVQQAEMVDRLAEGVQNLPEREQEVISRLFFGSQGIRQVAKFLGVTNEEVVKLRDKALKTLKRTANE